MSAASRKCEPTGSGTLAARRWFVAARLPAQESSCQSILSRRQDNLRSWPGSWHRRGVRAARQWLYEGDLIIFNGTASFTTSGVVEKPPRDKVQPSGSGGHRASSQFVIIQLPIDIKATEDPRPGIRVFFRTKGSGGVLRSVPAMSGDHPSCGTCWKDFFWQWTRLPRSAPNFDGRSIATGPTPPTWPARPRRMRGLPYFLLGTEACAIATFGGLFAQTRPKMSSKRN